MQRRTFATTAFTILLLVWYSGCVKGRTQDALPEQPYPTSTPIEEQDGQHDQDTSEDVLTPEPPTPTTPPITASPSPTQAPAETPLPERPTLPPAPTAAAPTPPPVNGEQLFPRAAPLVALAVDDLATQLGVPTDGIEVMSAEEMSWPDASLGCPQPGFMYAQVITPGWLMRLRVGEETYEYHTDQAEQTVLCDPGAGTPEVSPKAISDSAPWQPVEPVEPDALNPAP